MSKPRITCVVTSNQEVFFYLNPEGRDLLVKELLRLDEQWEHLHIQPEEWTVDLPLQAKAYAPDQETAVHHVKIMYRPDAWDEEYFPHVMKEGDASD